MCCQCPTCLQENPGNTTRFRTYFCGGNARECKHVRCNAPVLGAATCTSFPEGWGRGGNTKTPFEEKHSQWAKRQHCADDAESPMDLHLCTQIGGGGGGGYLFVLREIRAGLTWYQNSYLGNFEQAQNRTKCIMWSASRHEIHRNAFKVHSCVILDCFCISGTQIKGCQKEPC